jgi:hypothetical protein
MRRIIAICISALPLAAVAFGGAGWFADAFAPRQNVASVEMMQMLDAEHAAIADYVRMDADMRRRAYAAADQETAAFRQAALEQSRQRLAQAETAVKTERRTATAKTAIRIEPVAVAAVAPASEPLPLAQLASVNVAANQIEEGPVRARVRSFVSDVRRVPGWFASAADWMAESVPVPRLPNLPRLPGRQFRAGV